MKPKHHFDTNEVAQRAATLTQKMIVDLDRYVQLLDCDIAAEEKRVGISDRSDLAYPVLASMLATRRDNLRQTVVALEQRLSKLGQAESVAPKCDQLAGLTSASLPSNYWREVV
jgi:hypothetical protein